MKKHCFTIILFLVTAFCIIFPQDMITATKSGLTLWSTIILPSLLPFLILSDLIQTSALPYLIGKLFAPIMKVCFRLPGTSAIAIFLGMTGGYPIGAKTTSDLLKNNSISLSSANHLISFVNNAGPLFILGAIGIGLYQNPMIGILLLISHYLSALLTGFLFRFSQNSNNEQSTTIPPPHIQVIRLSNLSKTLTDAIKRSIQLIFIIGGFILIFSILSNILEKTGILLFLSKLLLPKLDTNTAYSILTGILEVTNGISKIATLSIPLIHKLIITSSLLGFAGFSVHLQTLSVLSDTNIRFSRYLLGKTIQSILSGIITYLLLWKTNFSTLLTVSVSAPKPLYTEPEINHILSVILGLLLFCTIFKLGQLKEEKRKNR